MAQLVADAGGEAAGLWVANDNAPGQVVIAGTQEALARAGELAKERGAKRAVPLAVSVPCHTPLMKAAAERLSEALERTPFQRPWAPVVSNVTASPLMDPAEIKAALIQQLSSPVRWVESVERMASAGVSRMIEIGPKAVVSGLVKRICPVVATQAVTSAAEIDALTFEE
ncbi:MAG: ACP S-malonyltransferase [Chloroflexi bacterium]|nr:ACP S-malonyltransferase [Chloroflexota bacterium]